VDLGGSGVAERRRISTDDVDPDTDLISLTGPAGRDDG
jgi:hypothetical protein